MYPFWLFEKPVNDITDHGMLLEAEARRQGCKTFVLRDRAMLYEPLPERWPQEVPRDGMVMTHGSLNLCNAVRFATHELKPGIWDNRAPAAYDQIHGTLQEWMLNDGCLFLPWSVVCAEYKTLFETHPRLFIKPTAIDKAFGGCTVDEPGWADFVKYAQKANGCQVLADTMIAVAPALDITTPIEKEWRFYVLQGGGVVTGSQYQSGGRTVISPLVEEGARELADLVSRQGLVIDPVYVVDICRVGTEYKVVELGTFSPSGVYAPDIPCLVSTINQICEQLYG